MLFKLIGRKQKDLYYYSHPKNDDLGELERKLKEENKEGGMGYSGGETGPEGQTATETYDELSDQSVIVENPRWTLSSKRERRC